MKNKINYSMIYIKCFSIYDRTYIWLTNKSLYVYTITDKYNIFNYIFNVFKN